MSSVFELRGDLYTASRPPLTLKIVSYSFEHAPSPDERIGAALFAVDEDIVGISSGLDPS